MTPDPVVGAPALAEDLAALLRPDGVTAARVRVGGAAIASFGPVTGPPVASHTSGPVQLETWGVPAGRLSGLARLCAATAERVASTVDRTVPPLSDAATQPVGPNVGTTTGIVADHDAAARIAQMVLPTGPPVLPGYDVAHATFPARAAGGDFVTYAVRGDDLHVAVGDVSGKGLPAALIMTRVKAALDGAFTRHGVDRVGEVAAEVTDGLYRYLVDNHRIVTVVVGGLDAAAGTVRLYNAGHSPAYVVRGGEPVELPASAPPLGVLPEATGVVEELAIDPRSWLLVGSDGLVEQEDVRGSMFGRDRMAGAITELDGYSAGVVVSQLLSAVEEHGGEVPPGDDRTVLVIRRPVGLDGDPASKRPDSTLRFDADLVTVRRLGSWLRRTADRLGTQVSAVGRLELALHEICVNIVEHAYRGSGGPVVIQCWVRGDRWRVEVRDRGAPYDAARRSAPDPAEPQVRGYGLMLVEQLAETLNYRRDGPDNVWQLDLSL